MTRIGHILGAAGLLYGAVALIVPLAAVTLYRVPRNRTVPRSDVRRTWTGWLIMCRTAFHLLAAARPNRRLG